MISGVYKIVNTINGKFYIGSSKDIYKRWYQHKTDLRSNRHHSIHLQRSWNKHGEDAFIIEIICQTPNYIEEEQILLNEQRPWEENRGYNCSKFAGGGDNTSYHSNNKIIREKISKGVRNHLSILSESERKEKWGNIGPLNKNWRGGISFIKFKCPLCGKETKSRIYKNQKTCNDCRDRDGSNNPFFGKIHSEETKNNLRNINLGKSLTEETKNKCAEASNKFYSSERGIEYRKMLSDKISGENHPLYGVGHTQQSKIKMSMTKKQKFIDMTPDQRVNKIINSKVNIKMIMAEGFYFFNRKDAATYYKKSTTSINFRCNSKDDKWVDFKYIDKDYIITNKKDIVENIKLRLEAESLGGIDN